MARKLHQNGEIIDGRAPRASGLARLLLTRGLPGSIAVVAALTIPEFSVGAGDVGGGKRRPKPPEPPVKEGQGFGRPVPNAATAPLAGVRYGGVLAIRETSRAASASPERKVVAVPPSQPIKATAAVAITPTIRHAVPFSGAVNSDPLDEAVTYAASLLDSVAVEPGLLAAGPSDSPAPALAKPAAIDMAASYAAMALDRFAVGAASKLEQVAEWEPQIDVLADRVGPDQHEAALMFPDVRMGVAGEVGAASPLPLLDAAPASVPEIEVEAFASVAPEPASSAVAAPAAVAAAPLAAPRAATVQAVRTPMTPASVSPPAAMAAVPEPFTNPPAGLATPAPTARDTSAALAFDIASQLVTRVDGKTAGKVDFRQTATGLSVRLGSIVSVLSDRYDPGEVTRITTSAASNAYVSLADLQAQGIPISYDPVYDEFNIGQTDTRPKAARKVHIDQISAPERGAAAALVGQVRR